MNSKTLLIFATIALAASASHAATNYEVVCSYAPSQSAAVNRITAGAGGAGAGAAAMLQATGLSLVTHSSGAYILTGSGGYVAGSLLSPLLVPMIVTASVIVGGTAIALELSCAAKNHPDAVNSVRSITAKFNEAVRSANVKAEEVRDVTLEKMRQLNADAVVQREDIARRVRDANDRAIVIRDGASRFVAGYF